MEFKELKQIIMKIEKKKAIIAKNRDDLRDIFNELDDCIDSFDQGVECLEAGNYLVSVLMMILLLSWVGSLFHTFMVQDIKVNQ